MGEIEEGFYVAHLRSGDLLGYVYTRDGETLIRFPRTGPFPVLEQPTFHPNYVLASNLRPASPDQELDEALNMIRFIYEHKGRLQERKSQLEASAQTAE